MSGKCFTSQSHKLFTNNVLALLGLGVWLQSITKVLDNTYIRRFSGQLEIPPEKNVEDLSWEEEKQKQDPSPEGESMPNDELDRIRRQLEGLL